MSSADVERARPPLRVTRARDGRVLAGVCAGLPHVRSLSTARLRAGFILATLCGGIGAIVYLACWLVIPDGDADPDAAGTPPVVLLAAGTGGLAILTLLAGVSAAAGIFGLGWVMFGLAAVVLALGLGPLGRRVPAAPTLLVLTALTLPSTAVALTSVRLRLQDGPEVSRPADAAAIERTTYASGLGSQLIDLRRTRLPTAGSITLRIQAGVRRTIVALPAGRCVRVSVAYDVHPFASHLATLMSAHSQPPFSGVVLFGDLYAAPADGRTRAVSSGDAGSGPRLRIDFSSQGGSLYVRDYPSSVSPTADSEWPGYTAKPEPRPHIAPGTSRRLRAELLANWRRRVAADRVNERTINERMPGPCAS